VVQDRQARAKVAQEQDQQKAYIILNGNFFCLSCPSETFALQHSGFAPCEWLASNNLLFWNAVQQKNYKSNSSPQGMAFDELIFLLSVDLVISVIRT